MALRRSEKKKEPVDDKDKEKEKQLDDVDKTLRDMLFKNKKKEPKKPEPEEPEEEATVAAPPAPDPEPKPTTPKPTKKVAAKDRVAELRERELQLQKERLDLERERLELEKARSKQPEQPKNTEDLSQLSSDERYELEVFNVMATLDKSKYGDLPKKFSDVAKATAKYKAQWEKDNPGESFDPDDSVHDSFFESNQIKYDKKDFRRAENKLADGGEPDPKIQELEKSNKELLAKHKLKELEPTINTVWADRFTSMIEAINPEIVQHAKKGAEKLLEEFPVEGEEILRAGEALNTVSVEAHRILEGDGLFEPDPSNRVHGKILDIIRTQERLIPAQPAENQLDPDGRQFATWAQWSGMSAQEQQNYWHMGAYEVVDIISKEFSARVKHEIARLDKLSESRQKRAAGNNGNGKPEEKPAEHRSPPASPSSARKSTVDTTTKTPAAAEDKLGKIIRNNLFKRSS